MATPFGKAIVSILIESTNNVTMNYGTGFVKVTRPAPK
jgi:hypothetical protein